MTSEERRERHRQEAVRYRAKYPEKVAAANKQWRESHKEELKEYIEEWRKAHPNYVRDANRKHKVEHRDLVRAANKRYEQAHPEKVQAKRHRFSIRNRERISERRKERYSENPLNCLMSNSVKRMLAVSELSKADRSRQYIGCSPGFLRNHLESLFLPGMNWANYGEWHVDHIVPLSWWPIKEHPELLFEASHYSNLRPRWKKDNLSKGARFAA